MANALKAKSASLYAAQTRRQIAAAERDELYNKVAKGELVKKDAVQKFIFERNRQVRDNLQNIKSRIADLVAVEKNRDKCYAIIEREIDQALEGLSDHYAH